MIDATGSTRRRTLRAAGTVALVAAAHQMVTGVRGVRGMTPGHSRAMPANVDSELRFYAVWYAAAGVLMHQAAADARLDRQVARVLTGAWSAAACSRLLSLRAVGRPDPLFLLLAAAEFAVSGVLAATSPDES